MKVYSSTHDFDYSWDEVSTANWQKYCPWNKESTHVVAVDTLSRRLDAATGILRTERLITCKQSAPRWLNPFLGGTEVSHVYEVSYVTPPRKPASIASQVAPLSAVSQSPEHPLPPSPPTADAAKPLPSPPSVRMTSYNLTWSDLLSVRETVIYRPCPIDPACKTRFEQEAKVTAFCGGWAKVKEKIEGFTVERFGQNAEKGKHGFENVLAMSRRAFQEQKERQEREKKAMAVA